MKASEKNMRAIVICGPTGVGKTSVAIALSGLFNGEIVNADSMQIYRHLDIGSAKPSQDEQRAVRHHLIDIVDPDEPFDAALYSTRAYETIKRLHEKNVTPFIAGGTGLYIKALLHGLFRDRPCNPQTIACLQKEAEIHGSLSLHERLKTVDPASASRIHPNDAFRIIRALEVFMERGRPISSFHQGHGFPEGRIMVVKIGLTMDRAALYERIDRRVDQMIEQGVVDEVKRVIGLGYSPDLKPMKSIGYRHVAEYLAGQRSWDETLFLFKRDSRRYAKRQLTWFRRDSEIHWFQPSEIEAMKNVVDQFLKAW